MKQASLEMYWGLAFWTLLLFSVWLYFPGLQSGFILDDEHNLAELANVSSLFSHEALRFILEGESSSLGRPLSLISFVGQAYQWPNPEAFKYINLLVHLLNACLIFWILLRITRLMQLPQQTALWIAFLSTAIWLLHPFQVSTTLYVIQRMAQLGILFILLGILSYLIGRTALEAGRIKAALWWMSLGVAIGLFGVLAKETAILIVLFIAVIEFTLLAHLKKSRLWYLWAAMFLLLPIVLLLSYFTLSWSNLLASYEKRDFTLEQRLLTETRVLWDYVHKILLPTPNSFSVFHDDWQVSRHLLQPISTLFSLLSLFLLIGLALWKRKQWPVFAFAVLWFLAAHSLEGSIVPLKLYFEHRNYLALLGPVLALVYAFFIIFNTPSLRLQIKKLILILPLFWLLALVFITWTEIDLWRRPLTQAALWAELKPQSRYAQSHYAAKLSDIGKYDKAIEIYQNMIKHLDKDISPYLFWKAINCYQPELARLDSQILNAQLQKTSGDEGFDSALKSLRTLWKEKTCPDFINAAFLEEVIFQPLLNNANIPQSYQQALYYNYASFQAEQQNYQKALKYAEHYANQKDSIHLKLTRINWMIQADQLDAAQAFVEKTKNSLSLKERLLHGRYFDFLSAKLSQLNQENKPE